MAASASRQGRRIADRELDAQLPRDLQPQAGDLVADSKLHDVSPDICHAWICMMQAKGDATLRGARTKSTERRRTSHTRPMKYQVGGRKRKCTHPVALDPKPHHLLQTDALGLEETR